MYVLHVYGSNIQPWNMFSALWLHARDDNVSRAFRKSLNAEGDYQLYCPSVKRSLLCSSVLPDEAVVTMRDNGRIWSDALHHVRGHILALVLVRVCMAPDDMTVLTSQQRVVRNLWLSTRWSDDPLVFCKIHAVAKIEPTIAHPSILSKAKGGLFWKLSVVSGQRLARAPVVNSDRVITDVVRDWMRVYNIADPFEQNN
jgi:hypothetical protein